MHFYSIVKKNNKKILHKHIRSDGLYLCELPCIYVCTADIEYKWKWSSQLWSNLSSWNKESPEQKIRVEIAIFKEIKKDLSRGTEPAKTF